MATFLRPHRGGGRPGRGRPHEPARDWRRGSTDIGYRILDLRTGTGFESEDGDPLVGVRCEGSALFRCASYALLCLALGDPSDWPESAPHAWSGIPERVFFDEVTAFRSGPVHRAPAMGAQAMGSLSDPRITAVVRTLGVRELDPALSWVDQPEAGPAREARRSRGGDTDGLCPAGRGGTLAASPRVSTRAKAAKGFKRMVPEGASGALAEGAKGEDARPHCGAYRKLTVPVPSWSGLHRACKIR
jgi:hypothetical protein